MSTRQKVRLISIAWGERYIGDLLDYALPAVLAPGNLPTLADQFDCELVIVTEKAWFDRLRSHPVYQRLGLYCAIDLKPIDEFITHAGAYGMALTYALFRGFEELGPAMLDTYLIFFNADFIMADGSLRSVAQKILEGQRLILSPSYCVVLEDIAPKLAARRDGTTGALAIPSREMAALALRHRHNTIRGKTVNQRFFSMRWIDQFYWLVDENTLIGHQLPIALVSMRPTRILTEMRTYWDYGILSEACPGVEPCILADTDDFLMIELRKADTARSEISLGWPTPREIADRLKTFITRDPINLAHHTLVLHSGELPANLETAKAELDAYVESVLRELPDNLSGHIDHPNWVYHRANFDCSREEYLLGLGPDRTPQPHAADAPAPQAPPQPNAQATLPASQPKPANQPKPASLPSRLARHLYGRIFGFAPKLRPLSPRWMDVQPIMRVLSSTPGARILSVHSSALQERLFSSLAISRLALDDIIGPDNRRTVRIEIPTVRMEIPNGIPATILTDEDQAPKKVRLRFLEFSLSDAGSEAIREAFPRQICGEEQSAMPVDADKEPSPSPINANYGAQTGEFDFCICELNARDLERVPILIRAIEKRVRDGGSILIFHLIPEAGKLTGSQALDLVESLALDREYRIEFSGSAISAKAVLAFNSAIGTMHMRRPLAMARAAANLAISIAHAKRAHDAAPRVWSRRLDDLTSFVIDIPVQYPSYRAQEPMDGEAPPRLTA